MAKYYQSTENEQLLRELNALSYSLRHSHTGRRTASLVLRRSLELLDPVHIGSPGDDASLEQSRLRPRRNSLSPGRSHLKGLSGLDDDNDMEGHGSRDAPPSKHQSLPGLTAGGPAGSEKKGIWNWKPIRALSHIGMRRLGCLLAVDVMAVQALPASVNGLRLSVSLRKKETKDGAVQTMPARVLQGAADFDERLFIRSHIYCSGGARTGKPLKFEPRPFLISTVAIDAPELDFGRISVDLSLLVQESIEKSFEGTRVRQWDMSFPLVGKAKGGVLAVKLGFQIMDGGGTGLYNQAEAEGRATPKEKKNSSFSFSRRRSKSSFSVANPQARRSEQSLARPKEISPFDLKNIDDFSLDKEPTPTPTPAPAPALATPPSSFVPNERPEQELKDDLYLPDFEVVEKGVEIQVDKKKQPGGEEEPEAVEDADKVSASGEVVKEVVNDSGGAHLTRLSNLDAIAQQIKALELLMMADEPKSRTKTLREDDMQRLDAEEDAVTREFLQMLELEDWKDQPFSIPEQVAATKSGTEYTNDGEKKVSLSDLGKGLGPVVKTRDGGYLAATNPFDVEVSRKDALKLAMQISKPFILVNQKLANGFELFQRIAAAGTEGLINKIQSLTSMDELMGKTAEQIAFEGMASAIISGRKNEGASSRAARIVAALKTMGTAMSEGRRMRILTGIWNVRESPVPLEEILAFSLQKIEAMAVEALKVQAMIAEEEAPFEVMALVNKEDSKYPLDFAIPAEEREAAGIDASSVTLLVGIQMRDPLRRYEAVGARALAIIQAARVDGDAKGEEAKFKVTSLHIAGLKFQSGGRRSIWDGEKQRLTAMQWLVAYGLAKTGKKKPVQAKGGQDLLWSMSSRVMADMWLKPTRNPDIKVPKRV